MNTATAVAALIVSQILSTPHVERQHVPRVRYGGNAPRYIAPRPPSQVYRRYQYPPPSRLSKAALREFEEMKNHRPRTVDWKEYNKVKPCPYCPNSHSGGNCVPPRFPEKKDAKKGR